MFSIKFYVSKLDILVENMSKDEFEMIRKDDMDPPMVSFMPEMSHTSNILLQEQQVRLWVHVPFGSTESPTRSYGQKYTEYRKNAV